MAAKWQQVAKRILAMFMRACKQHNLIEKGAFPVYACLLYTSYLTAYKELEQAKEQLRDLNEENQSLRIELESQKQKVTLLEKDVERSDKEHKEIVSSMQEKIDKLETECSRLSRITYMQSRKILVISNSLQQSFAGVMVLPYDRITELNHMVGDYSEILYVPNDMPFPSRRYIQKLDYIQEKLHVFCTHAELIDYLENGR